MGIIEAIAIVIAGMGLVLVIMGSLLFGYVAPFAFYYRVRRRGYSPIISSVIYFVYSSIFSVVYINFTVQLNKLNWLDSEGSLAETLMTSFSIFFIPVITNALSLFLASKLPQMSREAHTRPQLLLIDKIISKNIIVYIRLLVRYFKFRLLGIAFMAFMLIFIAFIKPDNDPRKNEIGALFFGSLLILLIYVLIKKLKLRLIDERKEEQQKMLFDPATQPYVLYLRSFNVEVDIFSVTITSPQFWGVLRMRNFDQYFAAATQEAIGPLIALGSPIDHWLDTFMWRSSKGAWREYAGDADWKEKLAPKLEGCAAIVLHTGITQNIDYELRQILVKQYAHKLFIMTKPPMDSGFIRYTIPFFNWIKGTKTVEWSTFSGLLRNCGYQLPETDPGPGSVFTFDKNNNGVLLQPGLTDPKDYLFYVKHWLRTNNGN